MTEFDGGSATEDTQPMRPLRDVPHQRAAIHILPTWALLLVMCVAFLSLLGTVALLLGNTDQAQVRPLQRITLVVGGEMRDIETTAASVSELLQEQGIVLGANDALSAPLDAALSDAATITVDRAREVELIVDGERTTLRTPLLYPQAILANQAVEYSETDRIWVDGTLVSAAELAAWPVPALEIEVRHTVGISLVQDGETSVLQSTADTVGEALFEADIPIYETDIVQPDVGTALTDGMTITIDRAMPIVIDVDGTQIETRAPQGTVLDALTGAGIALVGLDYSIPAEAEAISPQMTIRVVRVTEQIVSQSESIPFETTYQADASLELDTRQVIQAGQTGLRRINERVRYENGVEIGREPAGEEIVQQPVTEIVGYGTQVVLRTVNTPQGPREYWRKFRAYATSYHPAALGGDNITAIGETLRKGIIGGNPDIVAYRTEMYVPGYGVGIMADTGGARSSPYWIDLGYSDEDWVGWSQYVDVYLLTPVPADIDYLLPAWRPMRGLPDNG